MVSDLAFHLASRGWSVGAITSRQRYDDAGARLAPRENVNGVDVRRVWSSRFGRHFLPGRIIDYATFYASAFFAIRRERDAVIVAKTDPPLLSVVAALASRRPVNWLQDLFPEVANALGIRVPKFVKRIRDWSLRRARMNVAIGELMAKNVERVLSGAAAPSQPRGGEPPPPHRVRHSWADATLHPIARDANAPTTVAYSGNLGRAHEFGTMLDAMHTLPEVRFVITGDLNPHSFFYPGSTIMYTLGLAYLSYWIVGHFAGWFPDLQSFSMLFATNPTSFYLIGRVVAIVTCVGSPGLGSITGYLKCQKCPFVTSWNTSSSLTAVCRNVSQFTSRLPR